MGTKQARPACLIPAYKPTQQMLTVVEQLLTEDYSAVILVDDGGGEAFADLFKQAEKLGCILLTHEQNKGKGAALKTGLTYYMEHFKGGIGVVTADADGQHTPEDIFKVADALVENPDALIMGCRAFGKEVPFKSKAGNLITRFIYRCLSGIKLSDTQTGLRGIPGASIPMMLKIHGDRYEYEMSMLMEAKPMGLRLIEVPITTVYFDDNAGSHFNAVRDSFLIYKMIFSYVGASFFSFLVDYGLYSLLTVILPPFFKDPSHVVLGLSTVIIISNVGARIVSTLVNFSLNRKILLPKFHKQDSIFVHIGKYYALAVVVMLMDTLFVAGMSLVMSKYVAKIISGVVLYIFNFIVQKRVVFV